MSDEPEERLVLRHKLNWVFAEDVLHRGFADKKHLLISPMVAALDYGTPLELVLNHIQSERRQRRACQLLVMQAFMFFAFCFALFMHIPVIYPVAVEGSITEDIVGNANFAFTSDQQGHDDFYDVHDEGDFWQWFTEGYLPLVFNEEYQLSEQINMSDPLVAAASQRTVDRSTMTRMNHIIGGFRLRQERTMLRECTTLRELTAYFSSSCYGGKRYELYPDIPEAFLTLDPQREVWFYQQDSLEEGLLKAARLQADGYVDAATIKLELQLPVYNPLLGVQTLHTTAFYISRGGQVHKRIVAQTTYAQWYGGPRTWWPDALWLFSFFWMTLSELVDLLDAIRLKGFKIWWKTERQMVWLLVDTFTFIFGFGIIVFFYFRYQGTQQLKASMIGMEELNTGDPATREAYEESFADFVNLLQGEVNRAWALRIAAGTYPLIMLVRFFKCFAAQEKLSLTNRTIYAASADIVHFLLVFVSVFMAYVLATQVIFGLQLDGFETTMRAFVTCFRIAMGDFDFEELESVGRVEAAMWFCTFQIVIVQLMLNMLMAIIMDAYAHQAALSRRGTSAFMQSFKMCEHLVEEWTGARQAMHGLELELRILSSKMKETICYSSPESMIQQELAMTGLGRRKPKTPLEGDTDTRSFQSRRIVTMDFLLKNSSVMFTKQARLLLTKSIDRWYDYEPKNVPKLAEYATVLKSVEIMSVKTKRMIKRSVAFDSNHDIVLPISEFLRSVHALRVYLSRQLVATRRWKQRSEDAAAADKAAWNALADKGQVQEVEYFRARHDRREAATTGRQTVSECLQAMTELDWRIGRERVSVNEAYSRASAMSGACHDLHEENERIRSAARHCGSELAARLRERNKIADLYTKIEEENSRLKHLREVSKTLPVKLQLVDGNMEFAKARAPQLKDGKVDYAEDTAGTGLRRAAVAEFPYTKNFSALIDSAAHEKFASASVSIS
eukprot:TRINITY_DN13093_c0_g1_i1.p1 TRINITY_DN13093_c0_g1~~TRINITY_DN13093_c0_g1_i1.p1  ORF type:complete len:956 (+),score=180.44 TRINITY_DN13093_c0_g1_i1:259-3126(+)